jgi:hypothetical protein
MDAANAAVAATNAAVAATNAAVAATNAAVAANAANERDPLEDANTVYKDMNDNLASALDEAGRNNAAAQKALVIAEKERDIAVKCGSQYVQHYNINVEDAKRELNRVVKKSQANVAAARATFYSAEQALKRVLQAEINGLTALNASHKVNSILVATATKSAQELKEEKLKNKHEREMAELRYKHAQELADMKTVHNSINANDRAAAEESAAKGASRLAELKKQLEEL